MALPHHTYNLADGETFKVTVFRDHPAWDTVDRWWKLPHALLVELAICEYEVDGQEQLEWVAAQHPGCVYVY